MQKQVLEQVVIAIPLSLGVERNEEKIQVQDAGKNLTRRRLRSVSGQQVVAERRREARQQRGYRQESKNLWRLNGEHLCHQIVGDEMLGAGQRSRLLLRPRRVPQ
jgi:hypothetical protein